MTKIEIYKNMKDKWLFRIIDDSDSRIQSGEYDTEEACTNAVTRIKEEIRDAIIISLDGGLR